MSAQIPHLVRRWTLVALAPLLLAACDPNFRGSGAPVTRGPQAQSGCGGSVTTYPGDTVYSVSRRCNVSVRELIEANHLQAPYQINAGMVLRIPGGGGQYVVARGDTLLVVARKLGVDFQTLARVNNKSNPYTIYVGEKLKVPGSFAGGSQQLAQGAANSLVIASPNVSGASKSTYHATVPTQNPSQPAGRTVIADNNNTVPQAAPVVTSGNAPQSSAPVSEPDSHHTVAAPASASPPQQQQASLPPPPPPPLAGRGFIWPLKGEVVTEFGPMGKGQNNDGVNIAAPKGTPVRAAENGVVAYVGNELKGFGNLLLIKHADGWMTAYAHNDQLLVRKGEQVKKGQQIATVGASGNVTQPQLHFEIRKGTEAVNPGDYIKGDSLSLLGLPLADGA